MVISYSHSNEDYLKGVAEDVHEHGSLPWRDVLSNVYLPGMYNDWGVRPVLWRLLTDRC